MDNSRFKFRVWDKEAEEMLYPTGEAEGVDFDGDGNLVGVDKVGCWIGGANCIAMQSTGLKDKDGNLIYEGDCLGDIFEGTYVGWCNNCKQFELISEIYGCLACEGDVHWYEVVEESDRGMLKVLGNIYENELKGRQ